MAIVSKTTNVEQTTLTATYVWENISILISHSLIVIVTQNNSSNTQVAINNGSKFFNIIAKYNVTRNGKGRHSNKHGNQNHNQFKNCTTDSDGQQVQALIQ